MDGGGVKNDVGEMSSAVCWSVVEIVWCYGVWCAVPESDDDDVCGESGGPSSPALWVLVVAVVVVVAERWSAGVVVGVVEEG